MDVFAGGETQGCTTLTNTLIFTTVVKSVVINTKLTLTYKVDAFKIATG